MPGSKRAVPIHRHVLSLGAGINSSAMAVMLDRDELPDCPKPDWAVFADTGAEPKHVYDTVKWLSKLLSYPVVTTSWGDLAANTWRALRGEPVPERGHHEGGYIDLPVFSATGISRRQCTTVYKVRPIKAKIRELAQASPPTLTITQYLGFAANEAKRAKPSRDKWITNRFPLIEAQLTRRDLQAYLDNTFPAHPVRRSSCFMCPFRSSHDWRELKEMYPEMYEEALRMEQAMSHHPRGPWYLRPGGLQNADDRERQQAQMPLN